MALPSIDLDALGQASFAGVNRHLVRYLQQDVASILQRLPGEPDQVPRFVALAGQDAVAAGHGYGQLYSRHVLTSFLLGRGWYHDPVYDAVSRNADAPGMSQADRSTLVMMAAIDERRQLEKWLPGMHAIVLGALSGWTGQTSVGDAWSAFARLVQERAIYSAEATRQCYDLYRADFRALRGLPDARPYTGPPMDERTDLDGPTLGLQSLYVQLAVSFGRYFYLNPLYASWHNLPAENGNLSAWIERLRAVLTGHQQILAED